MAYSFSVEAEGGGSSVDMATYGLTVMGQELPLEGEPYTETVNLPARVGGYTYINEAKPAMLTLDVIVTASTNANLHTALDAIIAALPPLTTLQIHVDGVGKYWLGRRVSGIQAGLFCAGLNTTQFSIAFACDDPTAYDSPGGT